MIKIKYLLEFILGKINSNKIKIDTIDWSYLDQLLIKESVKEKAIQENEEIQKNKFNNIKIKLIEEYEYEYKVEKHKIKSKKILNTQYVLHACISTLQIRRQSNNYYDIPLIKRNVIDFDSFKYFVCDYCKTIYLDG